MTPEFEALWDALAQYVQNTEEIEEDLDERALAKLNAARAMLDKMDIASSRCTNDQSVRRYSSSGRVYREAP